MTTKAKRPAKPKKFKPRTERFGEHLVRVTLPPGGWCQSKLVFTGGLRVDCPKHRSEECICGVVIDGLQLTCGCTWSLSYGTKPGDAFWTNYEKELLR